MSDAMAMSQAAARSQVYAFLAQAFADPDPARRTLLDRTLSAAGTALEALGDARCRAALAAVGRDLDALDHGGLGAAHHRVFGHTVSGDCPPYEGEYGHAHVFQKTQCLADNNGFYRAFGLTLAPDFADRADHISVELEFLHVLAAKEAYALERDHGAEKVEIVREATRSYLRDHLGRWAPAFAARLESKARDGFYAGLARLLAAFVADEALAFDVTPAPACGISVQLQPEGSSPGCEGCLTGADVTLTRRDER